MNKNATPLSMRGQKSPEHDGNGYSASALQVLRLVVSNLPLDAALEVFRYLSPDEQFALGNFLFGRIVTFRKAAKHGRIPPEEIERIQELIRQHTASQALAAQVAPLPVP